jgi:CHAT domain
VLQLWGHGGPGVFVLEHADGSPDRVDTTELVKLLRPLRQRVQLAVVSACESAAATTAETLRLIGLGDRAAYLEQQGETEVIPGAMGVARALVTELDCAVVGMRYPVTDEFAIAFGNEFYQRVLQRAQPVDVAVARAAAETGAAGGLVELATPGVFGVRAAGLRLSVPHGTVRLDPAAGKMAYFPDEPERFVGRAAAMAAASMVLAPDSGRTGLLLHGMAGAGKTACALELAYRHQDSFAATAFWQAPTSEEDEFGAALGSLAARLDIQLGDYGFTMASNIANQDAFDAFLPRLRQVSTTPTPPGSPGSCPPVPASKTSWDTRMRRWSSSGPRCGSYMPAPNPATSRSATTTSRSTCGRWAGTRPGSGRTGWPPPSSAS